MAKLVEMPFEVWTWGKRGQGTMYLVGARSRRRKSNLGGHFLAYCEV